MDWFLYDNGLRQERVKGKVASKLLIRQLQSTLNIHERFLLFKVTLAVYANAHKKNSCLLLS